jgi:hypothetical protein
MNFLNLENDNLYNIVNKNNLGHSPYNVLTDQSNTSDTNVISITNDNDECCPVIQCVSSLISQLPDSLQNLSIGVYPDSSSYNNSRLIYNKLANFFPLSIFYPKDVNEVSYLIKNIVQNKLKFSIRAGGHGYEGESLSSGVVIDVTKLNEYIKISSDKKSVTVSSGFRLGKLASELAKDKLILSTGECACVGLAGISLSGGKTPLSRLFGIMCENILSVKLVNYKGDIINANTNENSDLLWALKGAGQCNFGVVTEFTIRAHEDIFFYKTVYVWNWNKDEAMQILQTYQNWYINISKDIYSSFGIIYLNGSVTIKLIIVKYGKTPLTEDNIFSTLFKPTITKVSGNYSENLNSFISSCGNNFYPFNKVSSNMVFKPISYFGLLVIINSFEKQIQNNYKLLYELHLTQVGGEVKNGTGCYYPKKAISVLSYYFEWFDVENTENVLNFAKNLYLKLEGYTSIYCFPSLSDYNIEDYMTKYYGDNKYKLKNIKKKYDPYNLFTTKQGIK